MLSIGVGAIPSKVEELSSSEHNQSRLLSLPLELREQIYSHIFATVYARRLKSSRSKSLAILQTCTQICTEASLVLYDRTPLRFIIGHRQVVSSMLPPDPIVDRFKNVFFKLVRMSSTHPSYEFDVPWNKLTGPFQNPIKRLTCTIQCELEEFAGRSCGPSLFARVKNFGGFETLTIIFEGQVLKREFPKEPLVGDDPETQDRLLAQMYRRGARQKELESLTDVEKMLRWLEKHLGEGSMIDVSEGSKALYAQKLVFHPLQHTTSTQH